MANRKRDVVTMSVDLEFFEKTFEPARRNMQKKLGINNLGQAKFTKMIRNSGINLDVKLKPMGGKNVLKKIKKRQKR